MATGSDDARIVAPPRAHTVSILPAALVLALAIGTLLIFTFINLLDSPSTTPTVTPVILGGLPVGSSAAFRGFVAGGGPPENIATALLAPAGTTVVGSVDTGGGTAGGYDEEVALRVAAPRAQLLGFYQAHLVALGWSLFSTRVGAHGVAQLLFQKAGDDSWYWELGVLAKPTASGSTTYDYRLFQASDLT